MRRHLVCCAAATAVFVAATRGIGEGAAFVEHAISKVKAQSAREVQPQDRENHVDDARHGLADVVSHKPGTANQPQGLFEQSRHIFTRDTAENVVGLAVCKRETEHGCQQGACDTVNSMCEPDNGGNDWCLCLPDRCYFSGACILAKKWARMESKAPEFEVPAKFWYCDTRRFGGWVQARLAPAEGDYWMGLEDVRGWAGFIKIIENPDEFFRMKNNREIIEHGIKTASLPSEPCHSTLWDVWYCTAHGDWAEARSLVIGQSYYQRVQSVKLLWTDAGTTKSELFDASAWQKMQDNKIILRYGDIKDLGWDRVHDFPCNKRGAELM